MKTLTHLDLFSGIGGFAIAAQNCGYTTIGFCEKEPYAQQILKNGSERKIHGFIPTPTAAMEAPNLGSNKKNWPRSIVEYARDSMTTSSPSTAPTTQGLTCSQGDFLVSLSASPGSEKARKMTERSGLRCSELLTAQTPVGSLVRTLLESSRWNSTISFLTWKASATPRGRLLFRLVPSMPDTEGTEFGLWPTTKEQDSRGGSGQNVQGGPSLTDKVKMWPTPTGHLAKETNAPSEANRNEPSISSIVGGSLNPQFVEWLMGYPKDWTAVEDFASGRKKTMKPQESPPESGTAPTGSEDSETAS